jgi:hypothetical protein
MGRSTDKSKASDNELKNSTHSSKEILESLSLHADPLAVIEALLAHQQIQLSRKEYTQQLRAIHACIVRHLDKACGGARSRLEVAAANIRAAAVSPKATSYAAVIKALEQSVRESPQAAFRRGEAADPSTQQLVGEKYLDFVQRTYLVAFSGRYGTALSGRPPYPKHLKALDTKPSRYFQSLARSIINERIAESAQTFKPQISIKEVSARLSHASSELKTKDVVRYLERLITEPLTRADYIWKEVQSRRAVEQSAPPMQLFRDIVEDQGRRRAQRCCAVLYEPWTAPWGPSPRLMRFIQERIEGQKSVIDVRVACGWKLGLYCMTSNESRTVFPALAELAPRLKRQ